MRQVNTIMLELLKIFPRYEFEKLEKQYKGNYYTKYFTGWQAPRYSCCEKRQETSVCPLTGQHKPISNKSIARDDVVRLEGPYTKQKYPDELRIVRICG